MAAGIYKDTSENWISKEGISLSESALAGPLLDNLINFSLQVLVDILQALKDYIGKLSAETPYCTQKKHAAECKNLAFGSLLRALRNHPLRPVDASPEEIEIGIDDFHNQLLHIKLMCYPE
ncbi:hypothetical protein K469DRAFT_749504 [Zopfia rhizophila CBS 207.26]|uniref:Uncharacterized protein n=1 Tax=Zopfia rhizophila CBS 207.26 TaxID=1314779 RepID=A0A6A6E7N4_9PEZI|nr:hypothetical protein K469DRAFT_749504 [Zopfia rhizophila CBS 207.26]